MLSRDFARPQFIKNNESKNDNTFRCEIFNLVGTVKHAYKNMWLKDTRAEIW